MWRVESTLAGAGAGGMGVMVCGGGAVCDEEAPAPDATSAPSPPRRVVNVGHQQYSTLPTLPARRALLSGNNGFVDNASCFFSPTAVLGSHFGSAKAQHSPADIAAGPGGGGGGYPLEQQSRAGPHAHGCPKQARGTTHGGRSWDSVQRQGVEVGVRAAKGAGEPREGAGSAGARIAGEQRIAQAVQAQQCTTISRGRRSRAGRRGFSPDVRGERLWE